MKENRTDFKIRYPSTAHYVLENVAIPFWGRIPNGLQPGKMIMISGVVNHGANKFEIDFARGNTRNDCDYALHFNPRFEQRMVVRNSFENGRWKNEEREPHTMPFTLGKEFVIIFLIENTHFKIAVNGRHYTEFKHRLPYQTIDKLNIEGSVKINRIEYTFESFRPSLPEAQVCPPAPQVCPPGPQVYPTRPQVYPTRPQVYPPGPQICPSGPQVYPPGPQICLPSVAQIPTTGPYLPKPVNYQPVYNPKMPFTYCPVDPVCPGTMFYISGRVIAVPNSFRLDIETRITNKPPADIALHFNPRFFQNVVVRNSYINGKWGEEEKHGHLPFTGGSHFDMIIRVESDKYMIAVNGTHFTEYRHRVMPLSRIHSLKFGGDIVLSCFKMSRS